MFANPKHDHLAVPEKKESIKSIKEEGYSWKNLNLRDEDISYASGRSLSK